MNKMSLAQTLFYIGMNFESTIVVDRHRFDADPGPSPDSTFHFDADPDPDPDPDWHQYDADLPSDPTPRFTHVRK
jgi:hypothetical protein